MENGLKEIFSLADYLSKEDKKLVEKAYYFAKEAHKEQKRKSGEPYFIHLIETAKNLASIKMDAVTISAGLLHDSIEDGVATDEEIKEKFGEEIYFLVDGVTKLGKVRFQGMERHNESLKKLFIATSKDIRVAIVKFADRIHNIKTLEFVKPEKRKRIALETLDIYTPLAQRLGISVFAKQLEDNAFPYAHPEEYKKVSEILQTRKKQTLPQLEKIMKNLKKKFAENGILNFRSKYRIKGIYSLYKKLKRKNWDLNKIHDIAAIRLITKDVKTCYEILGIIHQQYRPMPGRIKDYIAFPKPNGYQSIHTTVFTGDGGVAEIQIRTEQMDREAELGAASHISYKEQTGATDKIYWFEKLTNLFVKDKKSKEIQEKEKKKEKEKLERRTHWVKELAESSQEVTGGEKDIKEHLDDFFKDRIFVFTPNGDVIDLPENSTPIDFAFMIHTDLGMSITGARINNEYKSISTPLKNGDIVEIETSKKSKPTQKWLEAVKTTFAKRKIKNFLEKEKS